jgi:hypothetical protein
MTGRSKRAVSTRLSLPVAKGIDAVVAIVTVSAHIGAVRVRKRRISGELAVNFRMTRKVDKHTRQAASLKVRRYRITVSALLHGGPIG